MIDVIMDKKGKEKSKKIEIRKMLNLDHFLLTVKFKKKERKREK